MATQQDIAQHYDVHNDFYSLFLDREHRAYSCGVWDNATTLEQAQTNKLDRICRFAGITIGDKIIDVGCGWGGLMQYAISEFGAESALGLTLSEDQFDHVSHQAGPSIQITLQPWQDYETEVKFDAVVSVGAFEHFASLKDRANGNHVKIYKEFFDWCRNVSTEDAMIGLQTIITSRKPANLRELRDTKYLLKYVFPGTASPSFTDIEAAIAGRYEITQQRKIGSHYSRTLIEWQKRLRENEAEILKRFGNQLFEHYDRYFSMALRGFESGLLDLLQV